MFSQERRQPHLRDHYAVEMQELPSEKPDGIAPVKNLGATQNIDSTKRRKTDTC